MPNIYEIVIGILISLMTLITGFTLWLVQDRFRILEKLIDEVKEMFKGLESRVRKVEGSGSPLDPTEKGWKYLRESGLNKIIDEERREDLLKALKDSLSDDYTNYDVQEKSRIVVLNLRDDPEIARKMEEYSFENGIDVDLLLRLGGLLLRDNFLNREHNIAPSSSE